MSYQSSSQNLIKEAREQFIGATEVPKPLIFDAFRESFLCYVEVLEAIGDHTSIGLIELAPGEHSLPALALAMVRSNADTRYAAVDSCTNSAAILHAYLDELRLDAQVEVADLLEPGVVGSLVRQISQETEAVLLIVEHVVDDLALRQLAELTQLRRDLPWPDYVAGCSLLRSNCIDADIVQSILNSSLCELLEMLRCILDDKYQAAVGVIIHQYGVNYGHSSLFSRVHNRAAELVTAELGHQLLPSHTWSTGIGNGLEMFWLITDCDSTLRSSRDESLWHEICGKLRGAEGQKRGPGQ